MRAETRGSSPTCPLDASAPRRPRPSVAPAHGQCAPPAPPLLYAPRLRIQDARRSVRSSRPLARAPAQKENHALEVGRNIVVGLLGVKRAGNEITHCSEM